MERLEFTLQDRQRSCLIHRPPQFTSSTGTAPSRWPLVLAFHGGGIDAQAMADFCGLTETADEAGFLLAFPNGTGRVDYARSWNAGTCCGHAFRYGVDDVAFVSQLLDRLEADYPIDPDRIYATGMSNGAMLTYLLADKLSDRLAAVAPVAGQMGHSTCEPRRPVSVLHFHGTLDEFTPVEGGRGPRSPSQTVFLSVQQGIDCWVQANGCSPTPTVQQLPDASGLSVTWSVYGSGRDHSEVQLYLIHGGGHTWPGRKPTLDLLGASTETLNANRLIWEFFERHPRCMEKGP